MWQASYAIGIQGRKARRNKGRSSLETTVVLLCSCYLVLVPPSLPVLVPPLLLGAGGLLASLSPTLPSCGCRVGSSHVLCSRGCSIHVFLEGEGGLGTDPVITPTFCIFVSPSFPAHPGSRLMEGRCRRWPFRN